MIRLFITLVAAFAAGSAFAAPVTLKLQNAGTTFPKSTTVGGDSITNLEFDLALLEGDADGNGGDDDSLGETQSVVNRTIAHGHAGGPAVKGSAKAKSNPELRRSFDGVNFHDQRFSNNGNQFSVEPPDQALCVGNGFIVESANDVLKIYDTTGTQLVGPVDLNTFYGYPAALDRTQASLPRGPSLTDPICYFDPDTQRFFHVVLTLDHVGTTANLSGTNHLDIAVSQTSNPTGAWNLFKLPVQNNGTEGTPDHHCTNGFCLGDYPHIGADANAIFLTTNEFAVVGAGFFGAQLYAVSKRALAAGSSNVNVVLFDHASDLAPAFTVWPATSPAGQNAADKGGTEFFLSSDAVFFDDGVSSDLLVWSISNTSAIDTAPTSLSLSVTGLTVQPYAVPARLLAQKPGNTPLRDCIASPTCAPQIGSVVRNIAAPRPLAVNDSRMQQVTFANGKLWGALDTDVLQGTTHGSGIAYFVVNPQSGVIFANGTLALPNASLTYPAIGVTQSGRGVIAFTVVGPNDYPSAGYAGIDAKIGAGVVHVAAAGAGPWDSFTGYSTFSNRSRWGDYGASAVDGNSIWIASEYVAQTCTFAEYLASPLGECGGTRGPLGNWATRISQITP
jgi:hypothetical protein